MAHFWVTWRGRNGATINAKTKAEAQTIAEEMPFGFLEIHELPYPRDPVINPDGVPSFCFERSNACLDRTSCPRRRACDD